MSDNLSTVFGGGTQEGGESGQSGASSPQEGVQRASATIGTSPAPAASGGEIAGYDGDPGLKDFATAQPDGTWAYDYPKIAKTLADRLAHTSRQENIIRQLREEGAKGAGTAPVNAAEYAAGFDVEGLKQKAGRAYTGRDEQGRNAAEMAFWNAMHANGVPLEAGRAAFTQFMEGLHSVIEPEPTPQERLTSAVEKLGPNGRQQLQDVNDWVGSLHRKQAFSEGQQRTMNAMMHSPDGLAILWRLSRMNGSAAPPGGGSRGGGEQVMTRAEIQDAMVTPRYKTDEEYRKRVQDALARHLGSNGAADRFSVSVPVG